MYRKVSELREGFSSASGRRSRLATGRAARLACLQTTVSLHLRRWRTWSLRTHRVDLRSTTQVHALLVASNLYRNGSHSAVVKTSQRYIRASIAVGRDALGWLHKILRWVISIETWKIAHKVSEQHPAHDCWGTCMSCVQHRLCRRAERWVCTVVADMLAREQGQKRVTCG